MGRTILFSPVGGTDPIHFKNMRDGSLLHICRKYKPTDVILFLSNEILENHREDNRYIYCLEKLAEKENFKMNYRIIERDDLVNVHEYDTFYTEFTSILKDLFSEINDDDKILLNISSGTPAMKSSLQVINTLGEFDLTSVQVSTPTKKMNNEEENKKYDVEVLWELNEDNGDVYEDRCSEIVCESLLEMKKEEIIKMLIRSYDYSAALEIAKTCKNNSRYINAIKMANCRILLDFDSMYKFIPFKKKEILPFYDREGMKYFEYTLSLGIKVKKNDFPDFIRGISPIIVDLFKLVLKKEANIEIDNYCKRNKKGVVKWNKKKLLNSSKGIEINDLLTTYARERYKSNFSYDFVKSGDLVFLISELVKDKTCINIATDLRKIEEDIRNDTAHEIISVTDDVIKERTGYNSNEIFYKLKRMFDYTGIELKNEYWDSYDSMNDKIIKLINK